MVRNNVEKQCNKFAAEFLAPMKSFSRLAENASKAVRADTFEYIASVSKRSLLSNHATGIRLLEGGYITQKALSEWLRRRGRYSATEKEEERLEEPAQGGGQAHATQLASLGYLSIFIASRAIEAKVVDAIDVSRGLSLSKKLQTKAFDLASRRFLAAREP